MSRAGIGTHCGCARTRNPVRQALVSSSGTFWDTVVICALTGLVLVSSIIAYRKLTIRKAEHSRKWHSERFLILDLPFYRSGS